MLRHVSASWDTSSAASAPSAASRVAPAGISWRLRDRVSALAARRPRPELLAVMALAALLNLWALSQNGWANTYYSAAVRSMASSWHNFLFASLDPSGVMTVDKPPLALWVQAISVRVFGYHQLSVLVPQALMGVASVALVYDLVRRRFGRLGGFVGALALALTPMTVAISRHNNPDALLVLCCVAAVWCAVRALEGGRTRWLVLCGACVGLGFETKMGVALTVVPGIAAAWLWTSPAGRGRLHALRELLAGGTAMVVVGGAWPALVELTPAGDRPWVSGTSDNSVLSLIFGYNGLGRVDGQAGGPGGGGGAMFGSTPGPLRLLNGALGGEAGWLLGFAIVSGLGVLLASRLRRSDPRSGWLMAVGGAFLVTAALFSAAGGIFHPYYVSLLAPFTAALTGAGAAELIRRRRTARVAAPLAVIAGVACELVVLADYPGQLTWLKPLLLLVGALAVLALVSLSSRRARALAMGSVVGALMLAPAAWAVDTIGYAANGTFPAGGPSSVATDGGGLGAPFGRRFQGPFGGTGGSGTATHQPLFGAGGPGVEGPPGFRGNRSPPAGAGGLGSPGGPGGFSLRRSPGFGAGPGGSPFGNEGSLTDALTYVKRHGGGTVAVASQSSAASAIISKDANVAGIGGFSGRESGVSTSWLAREVSSGGIRWVLAEDVGTSFGRLPGDTRTGSRAAMSAVAQACVRVTLPTGTSSGGSGTSSQGATKGGHAPVLYDCGGRAAQLAVLASSSA